MPDADLKTCGPKHSVSILSTTKLFAIALGNSDLAYGQMVVRTGKNVFLLPNKNKTTTWSSFTYMNKKDRTM